MRADDVYAILNKKIKQNGNSSSPGIEFGDFDTVQTINLDGIAIEKGNWGSTGAVINIDTSLGLAVFESPPEKISYTDGSRKLDFVFDYASQGEIRYICDLDCENYISLSFSKNSIALYSQYGELISEMGSYANNQLYGSLSFDLKVSKKIDSKYLGGVVKTINSVAPNEKGDIGVWNPHVLQPGDTVYLASDLFDSVSGDSTLVFAQSGARLSLLFGAITFTDNCVAEVTRHLESQGYCYTVTYSRTLYDERFDKMRTITWVEADNPQSNRVETLINEYPAPCDDVSSIDYRDYSVMLTCGFLDDAVKAAMTAPTEFVDGEFYYPAWTAEEQRAAQKRLGILSTEGVEF